MILREIVGKLELEKKKKEQERVGHKSKLIRLPLFRVKRQQVTNLMRPSCGVGGGGVGGHVTVSVSLLYLDFSLSLSQF